MADGTIDLEPLAPSTGRRVEQVIATVRAALDEGRMQPGVKYSVYQLSEVLGISRTPVRDALLRLEEVGLIKFEARRGFRVLLPEPQEIAEIFAVRMALELPAVRRAANSTDRDLPEALLRRRVLMSVAAASGDEKSFAQHDVALHDLLLRASGNGRVRSIVNSLRETTRLLGASTVDRSRTLDDIDREHEPIVAAVIEHDPHEAEAAMRSHLMHTGLLLVRQAVQSTGSSMCAESLWKNVVE